MKATLVAANLAMGVTKGGMGLVDHSVAAGALLAINGFAIVVWNVVTVTIRQRQIPPSLLGRVNSVYRLIAWAGLPVGALVGGAVADRWGLRMPFLIEGAAIAALTVVLAGRLAGPSAAVATEAGDGGS